LSKALRDAIYKRLAGGESPALTGDFLTAQQTLKSLLADDPDRAGYPAVIKGNRAKTVALPCVVYRSNSGVSDKRFGEGFAVGYPLFEFEVWTKEPSAKNLDLILEAVTVLLDVRQEAPPLPMAKGKFFHANPFSEPMELYDDVRNEWALLQRWEFCEAQY
jgi:hypothetical protein